MDPYPGRCTEQQMHDRPSTAWQLIKSYWQSEHRFPAYLFCAIVMGMTVLLVSLNVFFTYWYYYFYEVMQGYDKHGAIRLFAVLVTLALIYVVWAIYRFYLSKVVRRSARHWLTEEFIGHWLQKRGYLRSSRLHESKENLRVRIREDVDSLVNFSIDLSMGLIGAITTFLAFTYVLWQLSDDYVLSIGKWGSLHITGYLIAFGMLYALMGTLFTLRFGRPWLPRKTKPSDAMLVDSEQNEQHQGHASPRFFSRVRGKIFLWLRVGGYQLTLIVPLLVVLPTFLDKVILISWLIQSLSAFNRVQDSLSSVVKSHSMTANGSVES